MKLTFIPKDGSSDPQVVDIPDTSRLESQVLLGRARNCDVQFQVPSVSRQHCRLVIDSSAHSVRICDLGSRNGTFVNREMVAGQCDVHDGDEIVVGNLPLRIEFSEASGVWERVAARYQAIEAAAPRQIRNAETRCE